MIIEAIRRMMGMAAPMDDARNAAAHAPEREDRCPDCGCAHFTGGGVVLTHRSDGTVAVVVPGSAVLSCLGCGARWYGTPSGLQRPHEASLPPAWAMHDLQARMESARRDAMAAKEKRRDEAAETPAPRGASAGFRRPPVPR
jgi:hypothetical protein